jgi:tetratricopeptide (TPR) repeat protein
MNQPTTPARTEILAAAISHHAAGRLDDAAAGYQQLHAANRRDSEVTFLLGVLCCDLGLFEAACRFLDDALEITPTFPEARAQRIIAANGLADAAVAAGNLPEAQRILASIMATAPDDAATLQALGRLALLRGNAALAEDHLESALRQRPDHAETLNWLGLAQLQNRNDAGAENSLRHALDLAPELEQAGNNLGIALHRQGKFAQARAAFETVLARDAGYVNARINLANTLRIVGQASAARAELERALATDPDSVDALNNIGAICQDLGQDADALQYLERAFTLAPASARVQWNLALTQLKLGDFNRGWVNFEARWEGCEHLRGGYRLPQEHAWQGDSLQGKRLLLWSEQGFGDTLQFIRFAKDVALLGATVTVVAQAELVSLLRSAPGVTSVYAQSGPLPDYDLHCPLMSLPHRLRVGSVAAFHGASPYLAGDPALIAKWKRRLSGYGGLKVGLVWAGSARRQSPELAAIDARRSMQFARLAPLLATHGCSFFSLQKDSAAAAESAAAAAQGNIHDLSSELHDFSDSAAVLANLDLVVSVDTAVAHLAGALGRPVWLLNRYDSCWRWLRECSDSPWYPSLRQFRQPRPGDWDSAVTAATVALGEAATQAEEAPLATPRNGQPTA